MRGSLFAVTLLLLPINLCAITARPQQDSTKSSAEQEIRAALCEIDIGDFANAEKRLESVLQYDSGNIYAQRLLLSAMTRHFKPGDNSPENIALVRKAIEACQRALNNPQFSLKEKSGIERQILVLYGWISQEEQTRELLRRVSDSKRTPAERATLYTILASKSWSCAFEITEMPGNKANIVKNNRASIIYKMPRDPKEFQAARMCVTRGMEEIENAIKLDPDNESAWVYKMNLLIEASKLAEMENKWAQKASYQKQAGEAQKRTMEISGRLEKEREEESTKEENQRKNGQTLHKQSTNNQPDDDDQLTKELTEYRAESSLDKAVEEFSDSDELTTLVAPVPITPDLITRESGETTKEREPMPQATPKGCFKEVDGDAQVLEKRDWKSFSPAGEDITVDLPDNVCSSARGYIAASEGVMYSILPLVGPSIPTDPTIIDRVLNTVARSFIGIRSRTWVGGGNSFEVKLLRKDVVNGQSSKVYAYALISCSKRKEGTLIVYSGKTHYYTVDISGANESDQRVQRFLSSVKFK